MSSRPGSSLVHSWVLVITWVVTVCSLVAVIKEPGQTTESNPQTLVSSPSWLREILQRTVYCLQAFWLLLFTINFLRSDKDKPLAQDDTYATKTNDDKLQQSRCLLIYGSGFAALTLSNLIKSENLIIEVLDSLTGLVLLCYTLYEMLSPKEASNFQILPGEKILQTNVCARFVRFFMENGIAALACWALVKFDTVAIKTVEHYYGNSGTGYEMAQYFLIAAILLEILAQVYLDQKLLELGHQFLISPFGVAGVAMFGFCNFGPVRSLASVVLPVFFGFYLAGTIVRLGYAVLMLKRNKGEIWTIQGQVIMISV